MQMIRYKHACEQHAYIYRLSLGYDLIPPYEGKSFCQYALFAAKQDC